MEDRKTNKVLLGTTPNGKELYYVAKSNATVRFIELGSGGKVPPCLSGGYSSVGAAQSAVNNYLNSLEKGTAKEEAKPKAKPKAKAK